MENSERLSFEEEWRAALRGVESAPPSEGIWLSIDNALTRAESDRNRKGIIFYQRLAASLLLVTAASLLVTYWQWRDSPSSLVSVNKQESGSTVDASGKVPEDVNRKDNASSTSNDHGSDKVIPNQRIEPDRFRRKPVLARSSMPPPVIVPEEDSIKITHESVALTENDGPASPPGVLVSPEEPKAITRQEEDEIAKKLKESIEDEELVPVKLVRPVWASLGFSGGSYSPSSSSSYASMSPLYASKGGGATGQGSSASQPVNQQSSTGTSYSAGVLVGKQVSRRWMVQAGLTYWKQRMDYESNIITGMGADATAAAYDFVNITGTSYTITSPYSITSTSEFLSIPVQLGYVLVDRKVGWIINAGVAPDIFLHNELTDKSGSYKANSQTTGDNSVFNAVSWSGLANTEVNLRLNEHLRFALVPGVRYSFTSITRGESGSGKPVVLDVGFRFRYMFK